MIICKERQIVGEIIYFGILETVGVLINFPYINTEGDMGLYKKSASFESKSNGVG